MAFEEAFDVTIPDDEAEKLKTVKDAIVYIGHKRNVPIKKCLADFERAAMKDSSKSQPKE